MKHLLCPFLAALLSTLSFFHASAAPNITATQDDATAAATRKLVGETITYTTTINNTAPVIVGSTANDATGIMLTNPTPVNTTDSGTVSISPVAFDDVYPQTVIANIGITSGNIPYSVFTNDFKGTAATAVIDSFTQPAHGIVTMVTSGANAGQFTYQPTAGYTGTDSFTYTISNSVGSSVGTVNLTVASSPIIWFVNPNAGSNGTGTLASPFNNITSALSVIGNNIGQRIFLFTGTTSTAVTLKSNGWLVGQGAVGTSFDTVMGITPGSGAIARPAINGTRPTIGVASGTGVTLADGNNVQGLNVTNSNGSGITGSAVGTLTLADFDVTVTGGTALSLTTSGTVTVTGTDNDLTSTSGAAINISSVGIGAAGVTLKSINSSGGSSTAVNLSNTGTGFFMVTGTGTTAGSGGTIQSIVGADAVRLNNTTGLATLKNMIIQDITATGDASAVNETHSNVDGIHGTQMLGGLALNNVTIQRISDSGINGSVDGATVTSTVWNGLSIVNSTITNTSRFNVANHADSTNEAAVFIQGLKGAVTVTGSTFSNSGSGLFFRSDTSGTLDMTVQSNNFTTLYKEIGTSSVGNYGIDLIQEGSLVSTVRIGDTAGESNAALGNTFLNGGDRAAVRMITNTGSIGALKVSTAKNTFTVTDHTSPGQPAGNTIYNFPQSGVLYRALGSGNFEGIFAANTLDQVMHADGGLGQFTMLSEGGATEVIVRNNNFKLPWDAPVELRASNTSGVQTSAKVLFQNNTYTDGTVGDGTTDLGGPSPYEGFYVNVINGGKMDLTIQNETLGNNDPSSAIAQSFYVNVGNAANTLNLFLQNVQSPRGFRLGESAPGVFNLYKNGSSSSTVVGVLQDNGDRGGGGVDGANPPTVTQLGTINLSTTAPALPSITAPLLFAPGEVREFGLETPRSVEGAISWTEAVRASVQPMSASAPQPLASVPAALAQAELDALVAVACKRWAATGLTGEQLATLRRLKFEVADLPGWYLGEAGGDRIRVDKDAGGNGWFTSSDDVQFATNISGHCRYTDSLGAPAGRIDLLTTVMHEMGHALGLNDSYLERDRDNVMYGFLTKGERRFPAKGQAIGANPNAQSGPHFLASPVILNTLPPGKTIKVVYSVTVGPITGNPQSVSSQAVISGSNFSNVTAVDAVAGSGPTITLLGIAPAITSANATTFVVGTAGNFTVTANGAPAPTFTTSGLPSGVTLSAAGVLSGTPAAATGGSYPITITANNGIAPNGTQSFTLTVNQAPAITSANAATFVVGTNGSFTVTKTGFPAPTLGVSGTLPTGVTFTAATGVLSGTPAAGTGGNYPITITASNGVGSNAVQSFTLTVNQAPAITSANTTTFTVGTAGLFNVLATGFPSPALNLTTGTLPNGVNFGTGTLAGTPTVFGTFPLTFTASNGVGSNAVQSFSLVVNPTAQDMKSKPSISPNAGGGFRVDFIGNPGVEYTVQYSPTLIAPDWQTLELKIANPQGTFFSIDTPPVGTGVRFYRAIIP